MHFICWEKLPTSGSVANHISVCLKYRIVCLYAIICRTITLNFVCFCDCSHICKLLSEHLSFSDLVVWFFFLLLIIFFLGAATARSLPQSMKNLVQVSRRLNLYWSQRYISSLWNLAFTTLFSLLLECWFCNNSFHLHPTIFYVTKTCFKSLITFLGCELTPFFISTI